jgi:Bacterial HORMA domain family 1
MAISFTEAITYTVADIEATFRRFRSDIFMIADSTGAITRAKAEDYAHDAEYLARRHYLEKVDITLISAGTELKACSYTVNESAGELETSRPGGVLWQRVNGSWLRIILSYTPKYTSEAKTAVRPYLKINWVPTADDTSHSGLTSTGSRSYASNGYGLQRRDFN